LLHLLVDGALLALPLGAAAFLLHKVVGLLTLLLAPAEHLLPQGRWFGIAGVELAAVLVLILALLVLGLFARSALGRRLSAAIENLVLARIPGYSIIKSTLSDLGGVEADSGLRPALVTLDDNSVLAFVVEESTDARMFTVFVPAAPGAASGSVLLLPRAQVQLLDAPTKSAMHAMKQRGVGLQALVARKPGG
jgi:uncharacterized membrane protein